MTKRMQWDQAAKRDKFNERERAKQIIRVPTNESFWQSWRDDQKAMRDAGYRVRKDRNGKWQAWIER
jgi:hypothetical protein